MTLLHRLDDIEVGERARDDLGDIGELATSIAAVGLLNPITVTRDLRLISGGRRLAAVRSLGWVEVPVTVSDLANLADILRAEGDENTCRKALTPFEASRLRERRAEALRPKAKERKGGRPRVGAEETSSKLDEVPPATDRATRKAAAVGTGYSGSTLDKVDKVRRIAERGTARIDGQDVPVEDSVREVAREAVAEMNQPAAPVDRAARRVDDALRASLAGNPDRAAAEFRLSVTKAIQAAQALPRFDPERTADVIEDVHAELIEAVAQRILEWSERVRRRRGGLHVVSGGKA